MITAADLAPWMPAHLATPLAATMNAHGVQLRVTAHRRSVRGTFRPGMGGRPPCISINGSLNPAAFFVTLTHEVAHLLTHHAHLHPCNGMQRHPRVRAHGPEWKAQFAALLQPHLHDTFLPLAVQAALTAHLQSPKYSSCADPALEQALHADDVVPEGLIRLDALPEGTPFFGPKGHRYIRGARQRTRYLCKEATGRGWLKASGGYLVKPV